MSETQSPAKCCLAGVSRRSGKLKRCGWLRERGRGRTEKPPSHHSLIPCGANGYSRRPATALLKEPSE